MNKLIFTVFFVSTTITNIFAFHNVVINNTSDMFDDNASYSSTLGRYTSYINDKSELVFKINLSQFENQNDDFVDNYSIRNVKNMTKEQQKSLFKMIRTTTESAVNEGVKSSEEFLKRLFYIGKEISKYLMFRNNYEEIEGYPTILRLSQHAGSSLDALSLYRDITQDPIAEAIIDDPEHSIMYYRFVTIECDEDIIANTCKYNIATPVDIYNCCFLIGRELSIDKQLLHPNVTIAIPPRLPDTFEPPIPGEFDPRSDIIRESRYSDDLIILYPFLTQIINQKHSKFDPIYHQILSQIVDQISGDDEEPQVESDRHSLQESENDDEMQIESY